MRIYGAKEQLLESALDVSSTRFKQLANNITNVNTPGYIPEDMDFQAELQKNLLNSKTNQIDMTATHPLHLPKKPTVVMRNIATKSKSMMRTDFSGVDIEREVASLIENNLYYSGVAQSLSSKMKLIQSVVQGGRQ